MSESRNSITSSAVKKEAGKLGADLCGIAPVSRFSDAPPGFHPVDVYPECRSVIVFGKRLPPALLDATSLLPYSFANDLSRLYQLDIIAVELCNRLEDLGVNAVPVPSDAPYEHWEADRKHGCGILSLRHAAVQAGLGVLGKNTLLITKKYGNMINLGAVLADVELKPDPLVQQELCLKGCEKCLKACPVGALNGTTAEQKKCRENTFYQNSRGFNLTGCATCRSVCPASKKAIKTK